MSTAPPPLPEGLVEAGRYPTSQSGMERALVVLSLQRPCWLVPGAEGFGLWVETADAELVREQLRRFETESHDWPPPPPPKDPSPPLTRAARLSALVWVLAEIACFAAQNRQPLRWERRGDLDPAALLHRHELWRPFTALFLHGDSGHLLSNLGAGYFAFCAALAAFGTSAGWRLIALAAYAGNFLAALVHWSSGTHSLGASTAIFAALGLVTGRAARFAAHDRASRRALFPPLAAGAVLLALYGNGAPDADVAAHVAGFASGVLLGWFATRQARISTLWT